jgi:hypothetical protein
MHTGWRLRCGSLLLAQTMHEVFYASPLASADVERALDRGIERAPQIDRINALQKRR